MCVPMFEPQHCNTSPDYSWLSRKVSLQEIVKLRAGQGKVRSPSSRLQVTYGALLYSVQFTAECLPEPCKCPQMSSQLSAAVLQGDHQHKLQRQLPRQNKPAPGLVTRLQTVTAANFPSCCRTSLQIQSRRPEQPSTFVS